HLIVRVLDAAGNGAAVLDRTVTVANPISAGGPTLNGAPGLGAANGIGATTQATLSARWRRTSRRALTSAFSRRETLVRRLAAAGGAPIAAAQVELLATPAFAGAASVGMKGTKTRADGSFTLTLPAHLSSRALRLVYRARTGEPQPAASASLRLAVRAP